MDVLSPFNPKVSYSSVWSSFRPSQADAQLNFTRKAWTANSSPIHHQTAEAREHHAPPSSQYAVLYFRVVAVRSTLRGWIPFPVN